MSTKQNIDISYEQFKSLVSKVCRDIVISGWRPEMIAGISNRGLFSAVMISSYFRIPLYTERNIYSEELSESAIGYVYSGSSQVDPFYRKNILIVDDFNNTGKFLSSIKATWQTNCLPNHSAWDAVWGKTTRVAAIIDNLASESTLPISYSGMEINTYDGDKLINFPYDQWWK